MTLQLGVKGLLGELGLVGWLRWAGEVDDGVRVGGLAQLLEALAEDVVVVGERGGSLAGVAAKGREPRLVDLDLLAAARLVEVLGDAVDLDLAYDLCDAVNAADILGRVCAAEVGGAAVAAVRVANVSRVGVWLGDDEVAVGRAGGEEVLNGLENLGLSLELSGVGCGLRKAGEIDGLA